MNVNKASIDLTPPSVKAARRKLLLAVIILSPFCLLFFSFLYQYFNFLNIITALLGAVSVFGAIVLPIRQKRITIYSALWLLSGLFFVASSSIWGYSKALPFKQEVTLNQIAMGLLFTGAGTFQMLSADVQRRNISSKKYVVILMIVLSIFQIGMGIFLIVYGIQNWNTLFVTMPIR